MADAALKSSRELLGVRIGPRSLPALVEAAVTAVANRETRFTFACANPHSLVTATSDQAFRKALRQADAIVADGVGCLVGARLAGVQVGPRITGFDFFEAMMKALDRTRGRAFFFGSSEQVLSLLRARCAVDFPAVTIETWSPPYGEWSPEQDAGFVERINAARPDVLWIAMTAPKQEKWMVRNLAALEVPVVGCIGAVFEYYAGTVHRAPQWVCRIGLEWLYRLTFEPSRLWRRTFVSAPIFLWACIGQRFSRKRQPGRA